MRPLCCKGKTRTYSTSVNRRRYVLSDGTDRIPAFVVHAWRVTLSPHLLSQGPVSWQLPTKRLTGSNGATAFGNGTKVRDIVTHRESKPRPATRWQGDTKWHLQRLAHVQVWTRDTVSWTGSVDQTTGITQWAEWVVLFVLLVIMRITSQTRLISKPKYCRGTGNDATLQLVISQFLGT
jgi:hypothetical protein